MEELFSNVGFYAALIAIGGALLAAGRWIGNVDALIKKVSDGRSSEDQFLATSLRAIRRSNRNQNAITIISAAAVIVVVWIFMSVEHESTHREIIDLIQSNSVPVPSDPSESVGE